MNKDEKEAIDTAIDIHMEFLIKSLGPLAAYALILDWDRELFLTAASRAYDFLKDQHIGIEMKK